MRRLSMADDRHEAACRMVLERRMRKRNGLDHQAVTVDTKREKELDSLRPRLHVMWMAKFSRVFWSRFDLFPPLFLRILARRPRGAPLTTQEIARRSGLSASQVDAISWQTDWRGVDLPTVRAFMTGVGIDLTVREDVRRIRMYIRTSTRDPSKRFPYLRRSADWQGLYLPMLTKLLKEHFRR